MEQRSGLFGALVAAARVVSNSYSGERYGFEGDVSLAPFAVVLELSWCGAADGDSVVLLTIDGATPGTAVYDWTGPSTIKVRRFDAAAAAADLDFQIAVFRSGFGSVERP